MTDVEKNVLLSMNNSNNKVEVVAHSVTSSAMDSKYIYICFY